MFPNASGDAPRREGPKQHTSIKSDEALLWQATHQRWKSFSDVRREGLFFDVVLKSTDGKSFPAHRIILCACSPYFKSLFSGRWESGNRREISIPGVTDRVMNHILQFAYKREIKLSSLKETKELLIVANHLGVEEILQQCFCYMLNQINVRNCVDIWDFARTYYCKDLEVAAKSYILKNIFEVACAPPSDEFQSLWNLSATDLETFLDDSELNVTDETFTFWIIVRWISKEPLQRHKSLFQLLLTIRWMSLSSEFVENVVKKNNFVLFCKETHRFVDYVKNQIENGNFQANSLPPTSTKRDLNGNYLIPPTATRREMLRKWSTPRLPRSVILVVGGWCGDSPSSSTEIYETRNKSWYSPNKSIPSILKRPRAYHAVLYSDGYMYIIGGYDGHTTYNSCDRYDIATSKWQEMCGMHSRRCYVGVALLDGRIYAFGGSDGAEAVRLKTAERFHPNRNVWKRLPDMHERRSDAGACSLGRRVYVAGGFTGQECVFTAEYYDAICNQWTSISRMTVARSGVSVVAYRNKVVVLGGYDGRNRLRSAETYDPETKQWTMLNPMRIMRSNFTACVIEGTLVVIGGFNGESTCCDVEYFDDLCEECNDERCPGLHVKSRHRSNDEQPSSSASILDAQPSTSGASDEQRQETRLPLLLPRDDHILSFGRRSRDGSGGVWKTLSSMKMSRSALSCCVVTDLPPQFLRSLIQEES